LSFSLRTFSLLLLRPPLIRAAYHYGRETGKEAKKNEKKIECLEDFRERRREERNLKKAIHRKKEKEKFFTSVAKWSSPSK